MSTGKTFDQLRADIIKDIDDTRSGRLDKDIAHALFDGVKVLTDTIKTEIAAARLCLQTQGTANEFGKIVRMGRRKISGDEE